MLLTKPGRGSLCAFLPLFLSTHLLAIAPRFQNTDNKIIFKPNTAEYADPVAANELIAAIAAFLKGHPEQRAALTSNQHVPVKPDPAKPAPCKPENIPLERLTILRAALISGGATGAQVLISEDSLWPTIDNVTIDV